MSWIFIKEKNWFLNLESIARMCLSKQKPIYDTPEMYFIEILFLDGQLLIFECPDQKNPQDYLKNLLNYQS